MSYLLLVIGLVLLVVSGDWLVKGSVGISAHLKISTLVVGTTVVAFGTSAPELIVSMISAGQGHPEIALGNVVGSNIANIALVLGLTAIILPMAVKRSSITFLWPYMMIASVVLWGVSMLGYINWEIGIFFLLGLALFIFLSIRNGSKSKEANEFPEVERKLVWDVGYVVTACAGLAYGSELLIGSVSTIAADFGISERIISVTIVAFGTSLPELTASIIAAVRKETDISFGNIVGSNIFNILAVLGFSSIVHEIPIAPSFTEDFFVVILVGLLLFIVVVPIVNKNKRTNCLNRAYLGRIGGLILTASYIIYIISLF